MEEKKKKKQKMPVEYIRGRRVEYVMPVEKIKKVKDTTPQKGPKV